VLASVGVEHGRQRAAFGDEPNGKRVDAVASVLFRKAFTLEHVAQVPAAVSADYLGAMTIRVGMAFDPARVLVIEAWPTAAGF